MEIGSSNLPINPAPAETQTRAQDQPRDEATQTDTGITPEVPQSAAPEEATETRQPEPAQANNEEQAAEPDRRTNEGQGRFIDTFV